MLLRRATQYARLPLRFCLLFLGIFLLCALSPAVPFRANIPKNVAETHEDFLSLPPVGSGTLRILSPTVLEVSRVTTKERDKPITEWNFIDGSGTPHLPEGRQFRVSVQEKDIAIAAVGFKRRVLYAPLQPRDLRIGNNLYLLLKTPIPEGAMVTVENPDGTLWKPAQSYVARADRQRWSPVIHVNQVGYLPDAPKRAMVGYYLGSLGELDTDTVTRFQLIESKTQKVVYAGVFQPRREQGWATTPPGRVLPYQCVREADFSAFRTPGEYRLSVPGLGVSFPFRIHPGMAAAFARTYALGLYHQRCGAANALPFTRFVHGPCHTAEADIPTTTFANTQRQLADETANAKSNPRHTAPPLNSVNASLYPFVRQGKVDVSGGHHDAGDYSKYTINSAQLIHYLVFAADVFPGAADLDNLGIPESSDGKSDLLQMAKWEADFLAKMQDEDGGFYFLVYPRDRTYEQGVLPDKGDPQVVFPKTTAVTAAATAALAQTASSPRFKKEFPTAAALYLAKARKGWAFLERTWESHGHDGSYQKITHYGDAFLHDDEIAWAAAELYLATDEARFHEALRKSFDPETRHWGWERLFDAYGCAIRSYVAAARSGRLVGKKLDSVYLAKCESELRTAAQEQTDWAAASAYGTSFPAESKRVQRIGWYFASSRAFDIAVAATLFPQANQTAQREAVWGNLNYEAGCNPNNVVFITGLGTKRQREIVHQYANSDRRVLPPSGIPLGSLQEGFYYMGNYGKDLGILSFPGDEDPKNPYGLYDRWGDSFNVATEFTIPIQGRSLATACWLMGASSLRNQHWRAATAVITGIPAQVHSGTPFTIALEVTDLNPSEAQIIWEAAGQEPVQGAEFRITPTGTGKRWIEAEAVWPDGRRAFAATEYMVTK